MKVSDFTSAKAQPDDSGISSHIKMPGMPTKPDETAKKPLIQVIRKKPTFCEIYNKESTVM